MLSLFAVFLLAANIANPMPCEGLKSLPLSNVQITAAELIPAGPFKPDSKIPPAGPSQPAMTLPAYCRVAAVLTPSPDSHIEMELWLPQRIGMANSRQ